MNDTRCKSIQKVIAQTADFEQLLPLFQRLLDRAASKTTTHPRQFFSCFFSICDWCGAEIPERTLRRTLEDLVKFGDVCAVDEER